MKWRSYSAQGVRKALWLLIAAALFGWAGAVSDDPWLRWSPLLFLAAAGITLYEALSDRFHDKLLPEREYVARIEDGELRVRTPEGEESACRLEALESVTVETNDSGPWGVDFWLLLGTAESELALPHGATGLDELLEELRRLEGFDDDVWARAVRSTENARFACWRRTQSA